MEKIVAKYAAGCSGEYLLPILKLPSKKLRSQYKSTLFRINKYLKEIAKLCGIATPLTMYVSRHSWASIAKSKNIWDMIRRKPRAFTSLHWTAR